jgi:glycosyltransferase involved in cell wall biosynthesis
VRIAFYSPRSSLLDLELSRGGDPFFLEGLFAALRARGHEIEVVSRLNIRDLRDGNISLRDLIGEAIAIRRRMKHFSPDVWLVYNTSRTYPDLFGWWQRSSRYVLLAAHWWQSRKVPKRWRWILSFAHQRSLARADGITVERPATAARLERAADAAAKIQVLPPAPRRWNHMPSREQARLRLDLGPEVPVVLCLARFPEHSRSGKTEMAVTLLRVLAELRRDFVLLLVGDDGPGQPRVEDEIARLGLEPRVRFVGPKERERLMGSISNEDVPWFYAAADVYAYPHPVDQPWLSLVEAQACGRPVVTMRTESSELLIRHGETGLLAADIDEFRSHLGALLSDPVRREAMGRAAYENFVAHHSMEHYLDRLEALLLGQDVADSSARLDADAALPVWPMRLRAQAPEDDGPTIEA